MLVLYLQIGPKLLFLLVLDHTSYLIANSCRKSPFLLLELVGEVVLLELLPRFFLMLSLPLFCLLQGDRLYTTSCDLWEVWDFQYSPSSFAFSFSSS